ncbi:D-alanyl-D-alanine carboxypeptidase/D-alanyl-D-alanine-endopeptidase [Psychrobacter coccoides]|uniref:D-alanyl-D-alanine carboxypeptidase/D-alanyl-D-alanine-endopeptidase n=1 Tax=Psychrobacter coccoides TaxID=2818440 RepID=UPI001FB0B02A|nr:D-alanyl-D-alanine carboxypeptidase [Psychrobacter coccoides]
MTITPPPYAHRRALSQPYKHLSKLTLVVMAVLMPLYTQAALPEAIETALLRAELTPADISIVVTPIANKSSSRLPATIEVIDTHNDADHDSDNLTPTSSTSPTPVVTASETKTVSTEDDRPTIQVKKQAIEQRERQINAYTDDAYTYQSIESTPTLLTSEVTTIVKHDKDSSSTTHSVAAKLSHQANIARTPASTMKLVPSFIALDTLGADFVWHTRIYHTGLIVGERLYGDLIIQGSGDPKMTHERLGQLLYHVQKAGIRHINGDIIIDSAVFREVSKDPAAFDNAPLRPYNASPDGFLVNFNSIGIKSYPLTNTKAQLTYTPTLADYQLPDQINIRSAACGQARYSLAPQWQRTKLTLNNDLPNSCGEHMFYVAYPDAKDFAARVLAGKWQALGNTLKGKVIAQEAPYGSTAAQDQRKGLAALPISPLPLVSYPSLSLKKQIYDINHFSNNVMTEQVALSLAAYNHDDYQQVKNRPADTDSMKHKADTNQATSLYQFGKPTTTSYPAALQTMTQWWQTNLSTPPPYLTNGSGLCRNCTITAENLSELLNHAYHHPSFDAYINSLGVAGVSGTIAAHSKRLPRSAAIGRAWIKTGTLNNVTSMAGYVKGLSGQDYVVVGLINTEHALNPYTARPVLDAMLDWTAQH